VIGEALEQIEVDSRARAQQPHTREALAKLFESLRCCALAVGLSARATAVQPEPEPGGNKIRTAPPAGWIEQLVRRVVQLGLCVGIGLQLQFAPRLTTLAALLLGALALLIVLDIVSLFDPWGWLRDWLATRLLGWLPRWTGGSGGSGLPPPKGVLYFDPDSLLDRLPGIMPHVDQFVALIDRLEEGRPRPEPEPFAVALTDSSLGRFLQLLTGLSLGGHHEQVSDQVHRNLERRLRDAGIRVVSDQAGSAAPSGWFREETDSDQAQDMIMLLPAFVPAGAEGGEPLLPGLVSRRES
jgi:hypothetical protein